MTGINHSLLNMAETMHLKDRQEEHLKRGTNLEQDRTEVLLASTRLQERKRLLNCLQKKISDQPLLAPASLPKVADNNFPLIQ